MSQPPCMCGERARFDRSVMSQRSALCERIYKIVIVKNFPCHFTVHPLLWYVQCPPGAEALAAVVAGMSSQSLPSVEFPPLGLMPM